MNTDFTRTQYKPNKKFYQHVLINGNISEIARNHYGYFKGILPEELSILCGYPGYKFVSKVYTKWLMDKLKIFSGIGCNVLDLFHWEERMGNWALKAKTEMGALGVTIYSPFYSHKLFEILLSALRKYRDQHFNIRYDLVIKKCSAKAS
jgi:hypothetical protein